MTETGDRARLGQMESLGGAAQVAGRIHSLITFSPLFENFNLAEVGLLSDFMQVYRSEPGVEIIREHRIWSSVAPFWTWAFGFFDACV